MLRISKLADYACLIMAFVAETSVPFPNATLVSASLHLGLPSVRKILQLLSHAGLLMASRGISGGYQLARPADQISLLEMIEAVDGKLALTDCCVTQKCHIIHQCQGQSGWREINQVIAEALRARKLGSLLHD